MSEKAITEHEGVGEYQAGTYERDLRHTFWISLAGSAAGLGTNVLMAHFGPSIMGAYGVVAVYCAMVSRVLYWGGNSLTIYYLPRIESRLQWNFLCSYFLLICLWIIPIVMLVTVRPDLLRYLFGVVEPMAMLLFVLWLAPVYVLHAMSTAALKAMMLMGRAQLIQRSISFGTFVTYLVAYLLFKNEFLGNPVFYIWVVFLGLLFLGAVVGVFSVFRASRVRDRFGWYLPKGFWRYSTTLQGGAFIDFLGAQGDSLLIIGAAGLGVFGQYRVVMTCVGLISILASFFFESLQPSIANAANLEGSIDSAPSIIDGYLRILFPLILCASCCVIAFSGFSPLLFGLQYEGLVPAIRLGGVFGAMYCLNLLAGCVLAATGKMRWELVARLARVCVFAIMFIFLWNRAGIMGLLWAWGGGVIAGQSVGLYAMEKAGLLESRFFMSYAVFVLVNVFCLAISMSIPRSGAGMIAAFACYLGSLSVYLVLAGYNGSEVKGMFKVLGLKV